MRCACTHLTDFAVGIQPKEVMDLLEDLNVVHVVNGVSFSIARIKENPFAVYALGVILVLGLLLATRASFAGLKRHGRRVRKDKV